MRVLPVVRERRFVVFWSALILLVSAGAGHAEIAKSPNDSRAYEAFELPNQLKVLLISDPETDKAAAALDVYVGSGSDPDTREGLAHFLEHMLFLGTEKYPEAGGYQRYISTNGGQNNAYTAFEHTNYYFDINRDYLRPALDRFGQFFVAPSFTEEFVAREKNAVYSEFQSRQKEDGSRSFDAVKQVLNPAHPRSRFTIGDLESLADRPDGQIRDDLIAFYRRYYSANVMSLVVLGREPLSTLRQWVTEVFSAVPANGREPLRVEVPQFQPGRLPARLDVDLLKDNRSLSLTFPIPETLSRFRSKPTHYLANLLGHEGKGSLLSLLKARGWSEGLSAGTGYNARDGATFSVSLTLTEAGLARVPDIVDTVFQYLRLVREKGVERWRFDEQRQLAEIAFRFKEKSSPLHAVRGLASNRQIYPTEQVLRGPYAMDEFDPGLIRRYLDRLRPDNVLVTVRARGLETDRVSPNYSTPYRLSGIAAATLERWRDAATDPALELPEPNEFIPRDLALRPAGAAEKPVRIRQTAGLDLWFQADTTFGAPRANIYFSVRSPRANDSPRNAVLTSLYLKGVNDQLDEFSYPAALAGLGYDLYPHVRGFSVRVSGYNDKQDRLLEKIVTTLRRTAVDPARFAVFKDELARALANAKKNRPYQQTLRGVTRLLLSPYWTKEQRLAALAPLEASDLAEFIPRLLSRLSVVMLAHGNLSRDRALRLAGIVEQSIVRPATPVAVPRARVVKLPEGGRFRRELEIDNPDSAVSVYFQGAARSFAERARFALLGQILSTPFYYELRTVKQLGYVVFATPLPLMDAPGVAFVIQSPGTGAGELARQVERFITGFASTLAAMSEAEFEQQKEGLLTRILEADKTLGERSGRYWREIDRERYTFDSRERLAAAIRAIGRDEFAAFYRRALTEEGQRRLVLLSYGTDHRAAAPSAPPRETVIDRAESFKEGKAFFAD